MQCGIYVRISLDKDGEALGVQRQQEDCTAKATALGWSVAAVYSDNDVSASKDVPRPEYTRMLADLAAGNINAVVVYDLDRLTRKPAELEAFIDLADKHGISLANVSGDVDLATSSGRLVARIKGAVARQEAERIGERVKRQKQQRAMQGIPHKGRTRCYGYDKDWNLIPAEAATMKEAFERRAKGESTNSITNDFKARGITGINGNPISHSVLAGYLKNPTYAGKVAFKGDIVADSIYPAVTDYDTFLAAQANVANDSAGTGTRKYLLSGILTCKHCLAPMKGNPSSKMYRCSTTYGGCGRLSVRIELADKWVVWAAMQQANMNRPDTGAVQRNYDAEIASLETARSTVQEGFEAGIYTVKEAQSKIKEYNGQIKALGKEKVKNASRMNYAGKKWFDFKKMNLSQQRAFISIQIERVVVGPSISRGHQPFNPRRLVAHYVDGIVAEIEPDQEWPD